MATIKAVILKRTDKKGFTNVQIAVCQFGKTVYIPTKIKVEPSNFRDGILFKGKNYQNTNITILSTVSKYESQLNSIVDSDCKNAQQIKEILIEKTKIKYHKVSECFQLYMSTLKNSGTRKSYVTSAKCFLEFCKNNDVLIESVDRNFVEKYEKWLREYTPFRTQRRPGDYEKRYMPEKRHPRKNAYSQDTIATFLSNLKTVINYMIDEGHVKYEVHPFARITIKRGNTRANILSAESMKKIKDYQTKNPRYIECKDMFLLQFYLGGPNMADMKQMDFRQDKISYERQKITSKTAGKAVVTIPVIPRARKIIEKYINRETGSLTNLESKRTSQLTSEYNYFIKCIAKELNIDEYITFTSARKCFAQTAMNLGFSDNYINYLLGHSMSKARGMLDPYSKVEKEIAAEIIKVIAAFIDNPEDIAKIFRNNIQKMLLSIQS